MRWSRKGSGNGGRSCGRGRFVRDVIALSRRLLSHLPASTQPYNQNMQHVTNKDPFPLTSNIRSTKNPQPLLVPGLIHPRSLSDALIARRQKYNNHQRDEQRERACHPPLREDDTEVLRRPCEEHLTMFNMHPWDFCLLEHDSRSCRTGPCPYHRGRRGRHGPCPCQRGALSGDP